VFDLHVHAAPDITERLADDRDVVAGYAARGFTGCVLKAHYESTVGRAVAAGRDRPLRVFGGIALNQHVGGVNPAAVAACLESGGRVVWMPTADAHTQRTAGLPSLCGVRTDLPSHSYAIPPVDRTVAEAVRSVCRMVAEADAVLATGHLSTDEAAWLVDTALALGVRRLLLTHPGYTVPDMPAARAAELTARGALAEITAYQLLHQPGCDAARLAAYAREVGLSRVVLSSDAGQPDSPPPPDALELLIDALAREGLDRGALRACASELPERLVVP
jgi:Family of unknown function (DUF6282)